MAKTASFAVIHFSVAFTVGYALTGSVVVGSALALIEPAINTVAFYFHELGWKKLEAHKETLVAKASSRVALCASSFFHPNSWK